MTLQISIHDFSVIIEALDKYVIKFEEGTTEHNTLTNLINKLDEQGISQVMGE